MTEDEKMSDTLLETAPGTETARPGGMDKEAYFEIADQTLPGGGFGGYKLPEDVRFVIQKGEGPRLQDTDGNWYIDYVGGAGALILGHAPPTVVAAAQEQVARGLHQFGAPNAPVLQFAERLVDVIPCAEKVIFATTGSEATAYALRLARAHTGRDKILKFEGAFHGNHDYSNFSVIPNALSNYPQGRPDSAGIPQPLHDCVLVAPYNDLEAVERIVAEHRDDLACIIVEPVQRVIFPRDEFLPGLRKICDDNDVLLVFDESVTGFRLALGGAQEFYGIEPDLAAYAKIVGGGVALSAVAGPAEIVDRADPALETTPEYAHVKGTMHGSPIGSASGMATLDMLSEPGFYARLHAEAEAFNADCQAVLDRHRLPALVTGKASLWQFLFADRHPVSHADVMNSDRAASRALDIALLKNGIYVLPNVRRFVSAAHGTQEFEETLKALDAACRAVS